MDELGSRCCGIGWRELRPLFVPPDPCQRTTYRRGSSPSGICGSPTSRSRSGHGQAAKLWVIVGVSGLLAVHRRVDDPVRVRPTTCWAAISRCLTQFGALPAAGGVGPRRRASASGAAPSRCSPPSSRRSGARSASALSCASRGDPEAKGLVERANGYFETSFLPGRRFEYVADFNAPVHRLAAPSEPADPRHDEGPPGRGRSTRTAARCWRSRRCCPTRRWRSQRSPATGSLRAGRHQRLLGQPTLHRPSHRRARHARRRESPPAPVSKSPATPAVSPTHQTFTTVEHGQIARERCASSTESPTSSTPRSSRNAT